MTPRAPAPMRSPTTTARPASRRAAFALALCVLATAGCSMRTVTVNLVGDALAGGGGVYASERDPELVAEALPFGLKTMEGLLDASPEHRGLLLALAQGFAGYAYLLQDRADLIDARDVDEARALRHRAHGLYLRGRDFALRGLTTRHPHFMADLRAGPEATLARTTADDVAFLYWAGAAWAAAVSTGKDDLMLIAELPLAAALVGRVLDLDPAYEAGAAHEFFIAYEGGRPGGDPAAARRHYELALAMSGGARASVHLALAEGVVLQEQDLKTFRVLIDAALAIDPEAEPELRLVNTLAQRRARWLRARIPDLFLDADLPETS